MWSEVSIDITGDALLRWCYHQRGDRCWFDSAIGHVTRGRRSLLTLETVPAAIIKNGDCILSDVDGRRYCPDEGRNIWAQLDQMLIRDRQRYELDGYPAALTGFLSYEGGCYCEPGIIFADSQIPAFRWDFVVAAVVVDTQGARLVARDTEHIKADARLKRWEKWLEECGDRPVPSEEITELQVQDPGDEERHVAQVRAILEAIASGRYYQACLTYPVKFARPDESLFRRYQVLRQSSPGDYGGYFKWGDVELASVSPEEFLSFDGRRIRARPMKGTRRKGNGSAEELADELQNSTKDRAENIMIVDLLRNDLGRSCKPGTVKVTDLCEIEEYSTVMQMTSTVEGELRDDMGVFGAVSEAFPPGSMTGAPKIEACNHLYELEAELRGLYSGTVGWVGYDHRAVFNVVIRSFQAWANTLRWNTGGGIVFDSTPGGEWEESRTKLIAGWPENGLSR